jgi:hypothetical protein
MTAILISSRPEIPRVRASAGTYRRRRATVGGVFVGVLVLLGAMATGSLAGPGGVPASATGAQPTYQRETLLARPGDTLWSIAHASRGDVAHDAYLDALVRLNGGASIEAGQRIVLP